MSRISTPAVHGSKVRTVAFLLILICVGGYVAFKYKDYLRETMDSPERLPKIRPLGADIDALDQDGNPVSFEALKGKVWVMSTFYTGWNSPIPGKDVIDRMRELSRIYADDKDFHLVAVTANPKVDTPEVITAWLKENDIRPTGWTFVTGDEKTLRSYQVKYFQHQVVRQKDKELAKKHGKWDHNATPVLVDREGWIRGEGYKITDPTKGDAWFKKLQMDIDKQLAAGRKKEPKEEDKKVKGEGEGEGEDEEETQKREEPAETAK